MDLLARREHSQLELSRKLIRKGFDADRVERIISELQSDNLQSDQRFAEQYVRYRADRGYGPYRIVQELKERGIHGSLINELVISDDPAWLERCHQVRSRRFGTGRPGDIREQAKQQRFLNYRGFTSEQIRRLMKDAYEE